MILAWRCHDDRREQRASAGQDDTLRAGKGAAGR
jgi:hypothetical protein